MKYIMNMSVRKILVISFVIIAILASVVGIVGLTSLISVSNIGDTAINNHALAINDLANIVDQFQRSRSLMRDLLIKTDLGEMQAISLSIDEADKSVSQSIAAFRDSTGDQDPVAMDLMKQFESAISEYQGIRMGATNESMYGDHDRSLEMLFGTDIQTSANKCLSLIDQLKTRKEDMLLKIRDQQKDTTQIATMTVIAILIAVVSLALGLGFWISGQISKMIRMILECVKRIAAGDLTVQVDLDNNGDLGQLAREVNTMTGHLRDVIHNVSNTASLLDNASKQVSSSSMSLAQVATEQASSVEEITASLTDISTRTKKNAENAGTATDLSLKTRTSAVQGNEHMSEMLSAMTQINESSQNISNIIKVIDDIAFQTNILALNAAVEAARAGQHGKGFAVVAEEVRSLAARSAQAASETTSLSEGSVQEVRKGTKIAQGTAEALGEIVNGVSKSADLISEISSASTEQSQGIGQINSGMDQVSQAVQTTSSVAQEVASSSSELSDQADILSKLISEFVTDSDKRQNRAAASIKQKPQLSIPASKRPY
jgi:methyl-accepting chemotaxis protein